MHTASLKMRDGLISSQVTTSSQSLQARAWCGDECLDQSISPYPMMQYVFFRTKSNWSENGEIARWADLTIRLIVKANSMSARVDILELWPTKCDISHYGIRNTRSLIVIGSITEVKQRRARFIIGWVTAWWLPGVVYTRGAQRTT